MRDSGNDMLICVNATAASRTAVGPFLDRLKRSGRPENHGLFAKKLGRSGPVCRLDIYSCEVYNI